MGSVGNQNFPPYGSYRDCSLGICSIYCPQWCYIIFPPPPPFETRDNDSAGTNFSPLIIAVIGILVSAFLLVSYYTLISKYCKRRNQNQNQLNPASESEVNQSQLAHDQWQLVATGLDESVIKSIAVFKFKKGDGLIDGSDCAVCLSEFQENENLRLLPKCSHAFHLPCIDTWLRSHSNCPLCRANVTIPVPMAPAPAPPSSNLNIYSLESHRNEAILIVEERERGYREEVVITIVSDHLTSMPKTPSQDHNDLENGEMGVQEYRRSSSVGSFSCQPNNLVVSDNLKIEEERDEVQGVGSSNSDRSCFPMKRSGSTGSFIIMKSVKGMKSILPN